MATEIARYPNNQKATRLPDVMNQLLQESFVLPSTFDGAFHQGLGSRILETNDAYIVQVALPGVDPNQVDIQVSGQQMALTGQYAVSTPDGARVLWGGLQSGAFAETFALPGEVDAGKADARYETGILTITVPKAEHMKPRTIKVKATG